MRDGLLAWYREGPGAAAAQDRMAYAALVSGVTLAQTGLGSVHGLASPLGAYFPIPHGVACGTAVASATAINLRAMKAREPSNPALAKYARVATILCGRAFDADDAAHDALVDLLAEWTDAMDLPGLSRYGVGEGDVERLVAGSRGSSMKTNPIVLRDEELAELVRSRL